MANSKNSNNSFEMYQDHLDCSQINRCIWRNINLATTPFKNVIRQYFHQLLNLFRILATLPVTTARSDGYFSAMKRSEAYLQKSQLGSEKDRSNDQLAMLNIHIGEIVMIMPEDVLNTEKYVCCEL